MKNQILKWLFNFLVLIAALAVTAAVTLPFLYANYLVEEAAFPAGLWILFGMLLMFAWFAAFVGTLYVFLGQVLKLYWKLFGEPQKS